MATAPILDSRGHPMRDGMINALTGAGTGRDPRSYNAYFVNRLTDQQIEAAYRSSWVMRKIIDKPATEMVREWRDWQAAADQIKLLETLERKLDLRNKVKRAEILRGLGGGAMVLYTADGSDPMLPLNVRALKQGSLRSVHVWHKSRFTIGEMIADPASDWCGHPSFYEVRSAGGTSTKMHPSRVIAFKGDPVPDMATVTWQEAFWGDSKVQTAMDAVQNSDTSQNGFAALIKDARNRRIGIPNMTSMVATAEGERILSARMRAMAMGESMFGATFYDSGSDGKSGEVIEDRQMVWAGIPEVNASYLAIVAGAADMPATVMLGKSPDGMNATGDGDLAVWEKAIKARQDLDLRPCLDQLDAVLIPSALGAPDEEVWWQFAPLSTLSEKDEATTFFTTMQAVEKLQATGSIPDVPFSKGLQNLITERGWVPGLDAALAELGEDERFPSLEEPEDDLEEEPEAPPLRRAANDRKRWHDVEGGGRQAEPPFNDGKKRHKGRREVGGARKAWDPDKHPHGALGRWTITGSSADDVSHLPPSPSGLTYVEDLLGGKGVGEPHVLGVLPEHAARQIRSLHLEPHRPGGTLKGVVLDGSGVGHVRKRHMGKSEELKARRMTAADIASAHHFLAHGSIEKGDPAFYNGVPRITATAKRNGYEVRAVFDIRKYTISLQDMYGLRKV